ncbi:hypothetical protein T10_13207 [Trichinella papuae]|uniref:Uncharacterized protein n=2 Tax=Trichinella TaxID=6333 RepID=A0A0V1LXK5_9BILA|nr:hypothetical protein T4D_1219 [Trichinella pseudospiralis]KRZ64228.1 hypothetical protein T10_13207 [Trichinella papuae]
MQRSAVILKQSCGIYYPHNDLCMAVTSAFWKSLLFLS